ncbi:MAG: FAD:protein FMN transferase [Limisphaerales bacterium]
MYWRLLICCAGLSSWLVACRTTPLPETSGSPEPAVQRSQPLLGTFVTITAFGTNGLRTQQAVTAAFNEISRVDLLLSIHKTNSETAKLNAAAPDQPFGVSPELAFVLDGALEIARATEGAFDPTIGPLAQLWGFIWKEYRLPATDELERVLPLVNYRNVQVQTDGGHGAKVSFGNPGMFLDFGGIGKGYAVDCAIRVLQQHGIQNAMVKAGGDLRVMGAPPNRESWEVQIEDPAKRGNRIVIPLCNAALSTSGNYENYFEIKGQRYSHIINPRTGLPVQGLASCTVIAPTCLESDAYATALFVLGIESSLKQFGNKFPTRFVDTELRVHQSSNFPH